MHPDSSNVFLKTFKTKFRNDVHLKIMNKNIRVFHCVPKGQENGDKDGHQWLISFSVLEQKNSPFIKSCSVLLLRIDDSYTNTCSY